MKRFCVGILAGLALAVPGAANAAIEITPSAPSGTFKNDTVVCESGVINCTFTDVIEFLTPDGYNVVGGTITSGPAITAAQDIFFGSSIVGSPVTVMINGVSFILKETGEFETATLSPISLTPGAINTLTVSGTTGQSGSASYSGTLTFGRVPAVPEPSTWLMLILGFGLIGGAMRSKAWKRRGQLSYV